MDTVIQKMEKYGLIPMISRRSHLHITPRSGWKIEFWGYVDEKWYQKRKNATHTWVLFDGMWLKTDHYNPGAELLKRYVDNIYRHLEHSEMLRGSRTKGGNDYKNAGFFNKCRDPVFKHACLDQLSPDGNIQFKDPISWRIGSRVIIQKKASGILQDIAEISRETCCQFSWTDR